MESVIIRSTIIYFFIFLVLRMAGKRTLSEMTTFDLVLVLIISEATQQALLNDDKSIMGGMLAILTLVFLDVVLGLLSARSKIFDKVVNGVPMLLIHNGTMYPDRMKRSRIQEDDILEAARKLHGLESINEIKTAVLEKDGSISIIPKYLDRLKEAK